MNKRQQGYIYEQLVVNYLISNWYKILAQNYTIRGGEIDIIARKNDEISFVEVKGTNINIDFQDYITNSKRKFLVKTAESWKRKNDEDSIVGYRFDLALVVGDNIDYIENFLF